MKRQFFLPAFWATLTGLSLLLIAAMTNLNAPESLSISSPPPSKSNRVGTGNTTQTHRQPVKLNQPAFPQAEPLMPAESVSPTEHQTAALAEEQPAVLPEQAHTRPASGQQIFEQTKTPATPNTQIAAEPARRTKRARSIELNLVPDPEWNNEPEIPSEVELRLASLTKQVDRLTNLQLEAQQKSNLELAQNTDRLEQATKLLQQMQQMNQLRDLEKKLDGLQKNPALAAPPEKQPEPAKTETAPADSVDVEAGKAKQPVLKVSPNKDSSETFSLQIQDADIMQVLDMLGELAGLNILTSQGVSGTITANLKNVTPAQALQAILRSRDLTSEKEGDFVYVMTESQWEQKKKSNRKVVTKLYSPFYVSAKELQTLITPILTENIGVVSLTTASEVGIAPDATSAGGDSYAQTDAILVRDYPDVLEEVDRLLETMDVPPLQVVIEAMIISVRLNDDMRFGVNFAMLSGDNKNLVLDGNGQVLNGSSGFPGSGSSSIVPPTGQFLADVAGLKYGFLHGDISGFIEALEDVTETNLIASPQLRALNKQKAELIIGERISYSTVTQNGTTSIQNVNFLDSGIVMNLRPFITPDGQIRMEIHPERSTATINPLTDLPDLQTTEVTTNVMVHDGHTVVIGGLIEERASDVKNQVPLLGAIPVIGNAFRHQREILERRELIVLITPRIVHPETALAEGELLEHQEAERMETFKKNFLPINQVRIVQAEIKKAKKYLRIGNLPKAKEHIKIAVRLDKNNIEAIELQRYIEDAIRNRNRKMIGLPPVSAPAANIPTLEGNQ